MKLGHMGTFFVDSWARAIAIHPLTGDVLTIHEDRVVSGNVLKIQQHTRDGEFVKSLVDFENIEEGSYDYYYPVDMVIDESNRIHALVNPIIAMPGEEMDAFLQTHFCIHSFDLDGNFLKETLIPIQSWPNRPREIACSGSDLYATFGDKLWKINLDTDNVHVFTLPPLPYPVERTNTSDIKCDQKGRILFSSHNKIRSDTLRSEIYRFDTKSGEFEKVQESKDYEWIETGCCQQPSMFFDEKERLYLVTTLVGSLEVFNSELGRIFSLNEPPIGDYWYPAWDIAVFEDYVFVLGFANVHVFRWE
jgi:hypothetical protein